MGRCISVPSNQKQIKSLLITSDAVSHPVTITIVNINESTTNRNIFLHFVFLLCFCSMWFVAGVGQVYFILSLFNSVPANNYSFTIESEN